MIVGVWQGSCRKFGIAFMPFFQDASLVLEPGSDTLISPANEDCEILQRPTDEQRNLHSNTICQSLFLLSRGKRVGVEENFQLLDLFWRRSHTRSTIHAVLVLEGRGFRVVKGRIRMRRWMLFLFEFVQISWAKG